MLSVLVSTSSANCWNENKNNGQNEKVQIGVGVDNRLLVRIELMAW